MPRGSPFTALCQALAARSQPVWVNLHSHTTASDGDLSPTALVAKAQAAGLKILAITDHDTVAGVTALPKSLPIQIVPGVEWTAEWHSREWHILGLNLDIQHPQLLQQLADVSRRRRERCAAILDALAGQDIHFHDREALFSSATSLGRRHIAGWLVTAGHAVNRAEAFRRYLTPILPTIVPRHFTPLKTVCTNIHDAGGVAVLAHPPGEVDRALLADMQKLGLDGVEISHPSLKLSRQVELKHWAKELGLLWTAGTDFHDPESHSLTSHGLSQADWAELERNWQARSGKSPNLVSL
ncbi:MAG: PHP domain-containing protein [Fimbriiglobus sp.]